MATNHEPGTIAPGTRLGPYAIVALIGSGGMGAVYRARDPRLGRDVAVKVLSTYRAAETDRVRRFEAEARAAGALNHPNVLAVYDVGDQTGIPYIVSELLEGETLRDRLRQQRALPLRTVVGYTLQILNGLDAAHQKGIVHRDLKPENLFLTRDGRVKILDFGLAKLAPAARSDVTATEEVLTGAGTTLGTIGYMSPEQVRGDAVDHRSDIFALAVVIHEMLSGQRPFKRDTSAETLTAILREDPPELPPDLPAGLEVILRRCLEKHADDRFHTAHDLGLALEAVASASGRVAVPVMERPAPLLDRRRAIAAALGAIAVVAVALGAGVFLEEPADPGDATSYQRLTFRRGLIRSARFAPDGQTIYYAAALDGGPTRVYTVRADSPESRPLDLPEASVLAISSAGEMALALGSREGVITYGTLARVPLAGGVPREIVEDVKFADWSPDAAELAIVRRVGGADRLEFPVGNVLVTSTGSGLGGLGFPRVSPDAERVAFIEYMGDLRGHVAVVDRAGAKTTVSGDYVNIFGLAWRGDEIAFTAADEQPLFRALHAVRPGETPRVLARMPGNASLHDITADDRMVIAHTDDRHGFAVLQPGDPRERDLSWLDASAVADLSPDGQWVLFTEFGQGGGGDQSVYLRRTDGSPAVRLGAGRALALSPDARWALARAPLPPSPYLDLIPTGPGETRRIEGQGLAYGSVRWLPDGRVVVSAREEGRQPRLHVLDLAQGPPRALTPEGLQSWAVSPDGTMVAVAGADRRITLYGIDSAGSRVVPRDVRGSLVGWTEQGLLVTGDSEGRYALSTIVRVDPATGHEAPWREIVPSDPAGIMYLANFRATPDGRSYTYSWHRALSYLYLVQGLQ